MVTRDLGEDWGEQPNWHIERARVKGTRQIPVELIVNGIAVDKRLIEADGRVVDVAFEYTPIRSSWVALREQTTRWKQRTSTHLNTFPQC